MCNAHKMCMIKRHRCAASISRQFTLWLGALTRVILDVSLNVLDWQWQIRRGE